MQKQLLGMGVAAVALAVMAAPQMANAQDKGASFGIQMQVGPAPAPAAPDSTAKAKTDSVKVDSAKAATDSAKPNKAAGQQLQFIMNGNQLQLVSGDLFQNLKVGRPADSTKARGADSVSAPKK